MIGERDHIVSGPLDRNQCNFIALPLFLRLIINRSRHESTMFRPQWLESPIAAWTPPVQKRIRSKSKSTHSHKIQNAKGSFLCSFPPFPFRFCRCGCTHAQYGAYALSPWRRPVLAFCHGLVHARKGSQWCCVIITPRHISDRRRSPLLLVRSCQRRSVSLSN